MVIPFNHLEISSTYYYVTHHAHVNLLWIQIKPHNYCTWLVTHRFWSTVLLLRVINHFTVYYVLCIHKLVHCNTKVHYITELNLCQITTHVCMYVCMYVFLATSWCTVCHPTIEMWYNFWLTNQAIVINAIIYWVTNA